MVEEVVDTVGRHRKQQTATIRRFSRTAASEGDSTATGWAAPGRTAGTGWDNAPNRHPETFGSFAGYPGYDGDDPSAHRTDRYRRDSYDTTPQQWYLAPIDTTSFDPGPATAEPDSSGRHRQSTPGTGIRRSSLLALTGLLPVGLVGMTAAGNIGTAQPTTAVLGADLPEGEPDPEPVPVAPAATAATPEATHTEHALAEQSPAADPVVQSVTLAGDRADAGLPDGPLGMPGIAEDAYRTAARTIAAQDPGCAMPWNLLAGIGRVESTHAFGSADRDGYPLQPVMGPDLDGSLGGNRVISDTDGGALDGLLGYDRAVGPMQFLPETWHAYAQDGNGDGVADPQNLYDAALTAGRYLCDGGLDMRDLGQQSTAILRYNNSMAYVANVMAWSTAYATGQAPQPESLPGI